MVFFLLVMNLQQQTLQLKQLRHRDEQGAAFLAEAALAAEAGDSPGLEFTDFVELKQPACGKYFEVLLLGAGRCRPPWWR